MTKLFSIILLSVLACSAFAKENYSCARQVSNRLLTESNQSSDWSFESLNLVSKKSAVNKIDDALNMDLISETDFEKIKNELKSKVMVNENEVFIFQWTAPSNSGETLVVVNKDNCNQVGALVLYSEE